MSNWPRWIPSMMSVMTTTRTNFITMMKPWKERRLPDDICLQRDSLDLYVDDVLTDSAPIGYGGMQRLKDIAGDITQCGVLFQIKIRNSVCWESIPTRLDFNYEANVL